jgi:hypothetical protein
MTRIVIGDFLSISVTELAFSTENTRSTVPETRYEFNKLELRRFWRYPKPRHCI